MQQNYHGVVSPGEPAQIRELAYLKISKYAVNQDWPTNSYLLECKTSKKQLLIDAAADLPVVNFNPEQLVAIVTTHQHWDHHGALAAAVAATAATTYAGAADVAAITEQTGVPIGVALTDLEKIRFGEIELTVRTITGHTPGSIILSYQDPAGTAHIFSGDSLFPGGVGATFGDAAAFQQLITDVEQKIFANYSDSTWIYPGHGSDTQLGIERPALSEWRNRGY